MPNMKTPPKNRRVEMHPDQLKALSPSQYDAYNYLSKKRIFEFFQFLICHLLAEQPEDPVAFLGNLLDRCMMFRSGLAEPPLLFTETHVEAMYRALDPHAKGRITRQQYETGLKSMNIVGFNAHPVTDGEGMVAKEAFTEEALDCLRRSLLAMLRVGDVSGPSTSWKIPILDVASPTESAAERADAELEAAAAAPTPPQVLARPLPPASAPGYVPPRLCNVPNIQPLSPSDLTSAAAGTERFKPGYVSPPKKKEAAAGPVGLGMVRAANKAAHKAPLLPPELELLLRNLDLRDRDKITDFPPQPVCDDGDDGQPERVLAEHLPTYDAADAAAD